MGVLRGVVRIGWFIIEGAGEFLVCGNVVFVRFFSAHVVTYFTDAGCD